MEIYSQITKEGNLPLTPNQKVYLSKKAGKRVKIVIDERSNIEKIRFIEGAIQKYYFFQHNVGVFKDFRDARLSLKKLFNLGWYINPEGKQEEVIESMSKIYASKTKTQKFIDSCQIMFEQNGYEFPDSHDYNRWSDTAVEPDAIYPPLKDLIARYKTLAMDVDTKNETPWRV